MSVAGSNKRHFVLLDGLRGAAAIIVVLLHIQQIALHRPGLGHAYLAVDFFFCLSGFVIAYSYENRLSGDMTFLDFITRRAIRLYPMIFIGVALGSMSLLAKAFITKGDLTNPLVFSVAGFLLLPVGVMYGLSAFPANTPLWSLFFEIIANVVYGIFRLTKKSYIAATAVSGGCIILAILTSKGADQLGSGPNVLELLMGLVRVAYPFLAGILIFHALGNRKIVAPWWVSFLLLAGVTLAPSHYGKYFDLLAIIIAVPAIVVLGLSARAPSPAVGKTMSILGIVSYPLYATHQPLIRMAVGTGPVNRIMLSQPAIFSVVLTVGFAGFAYLLYYKFDVPIRAKITRYLVERQAAARGQLLRASVEEKTGALWRP